jgi:hypothetical protein
MVSSTGRDVYESIEPVILLAKMYKNNMTWNGCRLTDIHFGGPVSTPSQHLEKPLY